ncbi:hypothetical protein JST99_05200 [Candidatus Dependentiae bacterium]|nr:hypothetical protein [Candidatus Dependentiae bacterium]MCC7415311.1 hypothetical protein [Campylobacterota bacterium]
MNEQWIPWKPITHFKDHYGIAQILYDKPKLTIVLYPWEKNIQEVTIIFSAGVISYSFADDVYALEMPHYQRYSKEFLSSSNFFKILNSSYIQNLSEQFQTSENFESYMHFVIGSVDGNIDIISSMEPVIIETDISANDRSQE